ncbi:hypothetical protein C8Q75DRAFT_444332 [Abortiporus biennis]|nr:hypothetical protein C8Q75DRAFT_444332 [Abortiporus biennis]
MLPPPVPPPTAVTDFMGSAPQLSAVPHSTFDAKQQDDLRKRMEEQSRTISKLEAEKESLNTALEQLKHTQSKLDQTKHLFETERVQTEKLQSDLKRVHEDLGKITGKSEEQQATISALEEERNALAKSLEALQAVESGKPIYSWSNTACLQHSQIYEPQVKH